MKRLKFLSFLILVVTLTIPANAQILKKLAKKAENAAERTILNRTDREVSKKTDETIDSILTKKTENEKTAESEEIVSDTEESVDLYQNFDFVPGDKIVVYDEFETDQIGDFPAKWDTNGSGEVVTLSSDSKKWLLLSSKATYLPHANKLPLEYTVEFDLYSKGIDRQTSSQAVLELWFDEESGHKKSANVSLVTIPFCQFIDPGIQVRKITGGSQTLFNQINKDIRDKILDKSHVSIAVNKSRLRVWIDENKVIDIPKLLNEGKANYFKLYTRGFKDGTEKVLLTNFKIAEGGVDLRNKLLTQGSFSTTGILFDSGSDKIKAESYGVLKSIAEALQQGDIKIQIIGHTDSDGDDQSNQKLSEMRAAAVKMALVQDYQIQSDLITTSGKGESNPVALNDSSAGKAQNRRVEFVKM